MAYNALHKLEANIEAIKIALEWNRTSQISNTEKIVLEKYAGFGGIKAVVYGDGDQESWRSQGATDQDMKLYQPMQKLYGLLKNNLDEKQYAYATQSLKNSILSAFYTPEFVARTLFKALNQREIKPRRIYEPSAGSGIFVTNALKAFPDLKEVTAVEKDILTGKVLQALTSAYEKPVKVHVSGLEETPSSENGKFDLVVSNIPFGNFAVYDTDFSNKELSGKIHNYFFAKGIDKLLDGGLLAYITTDAFLNSPSNLEARRYLFERANFVSLSVMPDNLMADTGGTHAPSHLLIVQKDLLKTGLLPDERLLLETVSKSNKYGTYNTNRYIENHPEIILGDQIKEGTNQYGQAHQAIWQNGDIGQIRDRLEGSIDSALRLRHDLALAEREMKLQALTSQTGQDKQFTFMTVPEIKKASGLLQLNLFDAFQGTNTNRATDYITEKDACVVHGQTARIVTIVRTKEHPEHESVLLLAAKSIKKNLYVYKLHSNVKEIKFGSEWVNAGLIGHQLSHLPNLLKQYNHSYLIEGDSALKTVFSTVATIPKDISIPLTKPFYKEGIVVISDGVAGKLGLINETTKAANFIPLNNGSKNHDFYLAYTGIRDTYMELIERETSAPQAGLRNSLNRNYDDFVSRYGQLNLAANRRLILEDGLGLTILSSVERKENSQYIKADVLGENFLKKEQVYLTDDVVEALARSLNDHGKVDINFIAKSTNLKNSEAIHQLENHIYFNPENKIWETKDQYLSGNVVEKLSAAQQSAALNPDNTYIQKSLQVIKKVQPEKIPFELLDFNLGERWIPLTYYNRFATNFFEKNIIVNFFPSIDTFKVKSTGFSLKTQNEYAVSPINGRNMYGETLFEHALENTTPFFTYEVKKADGNTARIPDNEAIQLANQKIESIRSGFADWLQKLPGEDKKHLEKLYNDTFNCYVLREYNGSHLRFPGLDKNALGIQDLYSSQKDAAWRIIQNRGALIDHEVGLGKTLTMVVAAYEMKRLGIVEKPMILALKANVDQISETFRKAYPNARILAPGENDFGPDKRQQLFNEIKNNNWDCVILTHDQFGKIPQSPELQKELFQTELEHTELDLKTIKNLGGDISKAMLKGLEIRKNNLGVKLRELERQIEDKKDAGVDFKSMGVDHLFVDESHKFKNLTFTTRHNRVAGLSNTEGSQKAMNMLFAVRTLQERFNSDLNVTFLSGTPISNSLTEMYLLFKYLRPNEMRKQGVENFDGWAAVFARKTVDFEFSVTNEIIAKERFRHFIKVPELALFYNEITDYKTAKHISLDKPQLDEKLINIKPTEQQAEFIKNLMKFASSGNGALIGRGNLTPQEDKGRMLIATNYAKKMAADMRLIDETKYEDHPNNKVNTCARKVAEIYSQSSPFKGTQIVFADIGTPKSASHGIVPFSIYDALKDKLIHDLKIPAHQITFIHDWTDKQKPQLFNKMNSGEIRILIGSTEKAGTGLNVQKRVVAMHHIDIPWKPSELEQRNGRGARQGNVVAKAHYDNKVENFIYAVEQSLDNYKFNLLKNKQTFISQMKNSSLNIRTIDEGAGDEKSGMNFSEYIALLSGDTSLLEKSKLEKKVAVLESLKTAHLREATQNKFQMENLNDQKIEISGVLKKIELDESLYKGNLILDKDGVKLNPIKLADFNGKKPEDVGAYLISLYQSWKPPDAKDIAQIGTLYGFDLHMKRNCETWDDQGKIHFQYYNTLFAQGPDTGIKYVYNKGHPNTDNPKLASRYFLNAIDRVISIKEQYTKQLEEISIKIPALEKLSQKPFEKEGDLKEMKVQLSNLEREIAIKIREKQLLDSVDVPHQNQSDLNSSELKVNGHTYTNASEDKVKVLPISDQVHPRVKHSKKFKF